MTVPSTHAPPRFAPAARTLAACALFALVFIAGCKSLKSGATQAFARDFSCPEDRVVAHERADVTGSSLLAGPGPLETPPAEVSRDPSRLAKWKADRLAEQKIMRDSFDDFTVFEVSGCDHRAFYGCIRPAKVQGGDPVVCEKGDHPPP